MSLTHNPGEHAPRFGLFPVRSPLLRKSLFIFSSCGYLDVSVPRVPSCKTMDSSYGDRFFTCRVSPFGYLRISVCLRLPVAFRSWPRPSSAYGALASALCSCLLHFLNPETMSFYFRLLHDVSITLYLLDWLSRKTHFIYAVVKIRLAFGTPPYLPQGEP